MPLETHPFDAADYLNDSESIFYFLQAALEDSTTEEVAHSLDTVVRALGFARLSEETGIPYHELIRTLNTDNRNSLDGLLKITDALGIKLPTKTAA